MKRLLILGLLITLSCFSMAQSVVPKEAIDTLVAPTLMLSKGRFAQAAESFHAQSTLALTMERKLGTKQMWQLAGLAEGLAAMAAEKNQDPIAYEYWANSVRYFLMSGTSWVDVQGQLHQEYEQSNSRLNVSMPINDTGISVDNTWLELFSLIEVWQERMNYFNYRQPSSDLALQANRASNLTVETQVSGANTGEQLRQYSPNSQLKLSTGFQTKQTFIPTQSESKLNPSRHSAIGQSKHDNQTHEASAQTLEQPNVIASPVKLDREFTEQDMTQEVNNTQSKREDLSEDTGKFRANLDAQSSKGISATQRRSFSPE
ncbi:hypothetical protein [Vibrio rhodolitus]|uniref:hypothetical protein n=1 Tax=Vibrio rhodolitus TaxID=2231649 RepID=UPI000E0B16A2|nr:hypothetical protein [Vibrio rhodolitus]